MGRKEVEFEVERRREDRTLTKDLEPAKKPDTQKADPSDYENWLENVNTMENMKYFVIAQGFVIFLTFGLPKLQHAWAMFKDYF